jgi:hypothetical protein
MSDLIDRYLTIHELEAFRESCIANLLRMSFDDITDVVKDIPAVNRWIPCNEMLPETDVDVLAYYPFWYDNMFQNSGIVVAKLCHDRLTWDICGEFNPALSSITHWMPLPERPEIGKKKGSKNNGCWITCGECANTACPKRDETEVKPDA